MVIPMATLTNRRLTRRGRNRRPGPHRPRCVGSGCGGSCSSSSSRSSAPSSSISASGSWTGCTSARRGTRRRWRTSGPRSGRTPRSSPNADRRRRLAAGRSHRDLRRRSTSSSSGTATTVMNGYRSSSRYRPRPAPCWSSRVRAAAGRPADPDHAPPPCRPDRCTSSATPSAARGSQRSDRPERQPGPADQLGALQP